MRRLPQAIEDTFRAALRETIFIRQSRARFALDLKARAAYHLDRNLGKSADASERKRAVDGLALVIDRFLKTRLCERLWCLTVDRVYAPASSTCDVVVIGADAKRYAVQFVIMPRLLEQRSPPVESRVDEVEFDELLVCDLATGRIIRHRPGRSRDLLCA